MPQLPMADGNAVSRHPEPHAGSGFMLAALTALAILAMTVVPMRPARAAPEHYVIDPSHMAIAFMVSHVGFANTLGRFDRAEGSFVFDPDKPAVSDIAVTIDAASVNTDHQKRDEHLRGPDFLWVEKYPQLSFHGTSAEQTGPRTGRILGDLSLRGVTRPVTLDITWNKSGEYPFGDKHYAIGLSGRTQIKRSDFGMTYGVQGGLVGDDIDIILEFEAIRQPS